MNVARKLGKIGSRIARERPGELKWTALGGAGGAGVGLLIGGVGIAAMGTGFGIPAAMVLGGLGAMGGNRFGVEWDRNADRRKSRQCKQVENDE